MTEKEPRYCNKCGEIISSGFVCKKCKKEKKKAYEREYQAKYYQKRKAELKTLREELARYKKQVEDSKNAD